MSPGEAIYILIGILIIGLVAWFVQWCAEQGFAPNAVPQPIRIAIWAVAALAALLVVLWGFDVGGPLVIDRD